MLTDQQQLFQQEFWNCAQQGSGHSVPFTKLYSRGNLWTFEIRKGPRKEYIHMYDCFNQMKFIFTSKNCSNIRMNYLIYSLPALVMLLWVRMEQPGSHWTQLHKILYLRIFRKNCLEKYFFQYSKNQRYFTWIPMYIYNNISLISPYSEKYCRQRVLEKIRKYILCSTFFPENLAVYEIMWQIWYSETSHRW
jgi:hypothetical protein